MIYLRYINVSSCDGSFFLCCLVLTHSVERVELNPAKGEEAEEGLEHGLAHAHHAGGERRAHCRAQELRVRQHAPAHCNKETLPFTAVANVFQ